MRLTFGSVIYELQPFPHNIRRRKIGDSSSLCPKCHGEMFVGAYDRHEETNIEYVNIICPDCRYFYLSHPADYQENI